MRPHARNGLTGVLAGAALLLLSGCADRVTGPAGGEPSPGPSPLGLVEVTISGIGGPQMSASARVPTTGADGMRREMSRPGNGDGTGNGSIQLQSLVNGSVTHGERGAGGYRYVHATFRVRNAQSNGAAYDTPRRNLTFVAASIPSAPGGSAFSLLRRFDGSAADASIASQIQPTGLVYAGPAGDLHSASPDVLQVFSEGDVAGVALPAGVTTLFPYGFVTRNATDGGRVLPASPGAAQWDGLVTFAFKVPLQATSWQDPFTVSMLFLVYDDATTRITQSVEEQNERGWNAFGVRAAHVGATQITVLPGGKGIGDDRTRNVCGVRLAGTGAAPTATAFPCGAGS